MIHPNLISGIKDTKKGKKKSISSKNDDLLVCVDKLKACINRHANKKSLWLHLNFYKDDLKKNCPVIFKGYGSFFF